MSIRLGNIQFDQVEMALGYKLTEEDRKLWNKYHSQSANLTDKESCFHIFYMPTCIVFKGKDAIDAILQMFTPDKLVNPTGEFKVYELKS